MGGNSTRVFLVCYFPANTKKENDDVRLNRNCEQICVRYQRTIKIVRIGTVRLSAIEALNRLFLEKSKGMDSILEQSSSQNNLYWRITSRSYRLNEEGNLKSSWF